MLSKASPTSVMGNHRGLVFTSATADAIKCAAFADTGLVIASLFLVRRSFMIALPQLKLVELALAGILWDLFLFLRLFVDLVVDWRIIGG